MELGGPPKPVWEQQAVPGSWSADADCGGPRSGSWKKPSGRSPSFCARVFPAWHSGSGLRSEAGFTHPDLTLSTNSPPADPLRVSVPPFALVLRFLPIGTISSAGRHLVSRLESQIKIFQRLRDTLCTTGEPSKSCVSLFYQIVVLQVPACHCGLGRSHWSQGCCLLFKLAPLFLIKVLCLGVGGGWEGKNSERRE